MIMDDWNKGITYEGSWDTTTALDDWTNQFYRMEDLHVKEITTHADGTTEISGVFSPSAHFSTLNDYVVDASRYGIAISGSYKSYGIKKILVNPEKDTTTVLWNDGTHTTVKRAEGDDPADIWQIVSYALAEKVYGSNSAFKREVKGKVEVQTKKKKSKSECAESKKPKYAAEIINHGHCAICGKRLVEGLFLCGECQAKINGKFNK